jgi:hypothetical protein
MSDQSNQPSQTVTIRIVEGDGGEDAVRQAKKLFGDALSIEQLRRFQKQCGDIYAKILKDPSVLEQLSKEGVAGLRRLGIEVDKDIADAAARMRQTASATALGEEPVQVQIRIGREDGNNG